MAADSRETSTVSTSNETSGNTWKLDKVLVNIWTAAVAQVLKHQAISIHNTDTLSIVPEWFHEFS